MSFAVDVDTYPDLVTDAHPANGRRGVPLTPRERLATGARVGRRLLLVEDDESMQEVLRALLEAEGYEVIGAMDGEEALAHLRRGVAPSLIVLDLMLPGMDGFEFRALQRANPAWAKIPVVVYSGMDRLAERVRALEPSAWFEKPIDPESLLGAIGKYCS